MPKNLSPKAKNALLILAGVVAIFFAYMQVIRPLMPFTPDPSLNPDPSHTHADFSIWVNGEMANVTSNEYMSGLSYDDASHDEASEYLHKYLHLHDNIGHVVHMHKPGLDIAEFFSSLGFVMTDDCFTFDDGETYCNEKGNSQWRMFVRPVGQPWEEADLQPGYIFDDLDKIMLTYGSTGKEIEKQLKLMTDDACLYSQACPWRGDPPEENCIADPSIPCIGDLDDDFS